MIKKLLVGIALISGPLLAMEKNVYAPFMNDWLKKSSPELLEQAQQCIHYKEYGLACSFLDQVIRLNEQPFNELARIGKRLIEIDVRQENAKMLEREALFDQCIMLLMSAIEKQQFKVGYLFLGDLYFKRWADASTTDQKNNFYVKALEYYTIGDQKGSKRCKLWKNVIMLYKALEENNKEHYCSLLKAMIDYADELTKQWERETDVQKKKALGNYCLEWRRNINSFILTSVESIIYNNRKT